jgi:transcriptional regulator with XRE-family HTH domain
LGVVVTDPARQEATQRTSHLLTRAMAEHGLTVAELARRLGGTTAVHKQIRRVLNGTTLPRIDTLTEMLRACGHELTISMKRKVECDDE